MSESKTNTSLPSLENNYQSWKKRFNTFNRKLNTLERKDMEESRQRNQVKTTIRLQNKQVSITRDDLKQLEDKLSLVKRQVEIGESEFYKRSFYMFFLQSIFVFILVSMLIALLVKNGNISPDNAMIAEGGVAILMTGLVLYNLYINRYRNPRDYNEINWSGPNVYSNRRDKGI